MAGTIYALIPALLTVLLVILTKKVILSLGAGVISAALIVAEFSPIGTITTLFDTFYSIVFDAGGLFGFLNRWNMSIIIFLIGLGIVTSFVILSGGAHAFTQAIIKRVKNREGVQYTSFGLGLILFIDDYFNALIVGNVSKPLASELKISRARVAYIVDSTSAPVCIAAPVSSWATAIMGTMAVVFTTIGIEDNTFYAFIRMIPYHFYVFTALAMVLITIRFDFNIGIMKKYEKEAREGRDSSITSSASSELEGKAQASTGTVWDLVTPILVLTIATIGTMLISGYQGAMNDGASPYNLFYAMLDHIDLALSLIVGGITGASTAMIMTYRHVKAKEVTTQEFTKAIYTGAASMFTAIIILSLAWAISDLIGELELGDFLAGIITNSNMNARLLPFMMFIVASLIAFATGTSWGSFGILLPIAGTVAAALDINLLLPTMSAVLSGAVLGDHASPISDTTLLSATGAGCDITAHFNSQLPYALISGFIAGIGYFSYGLTKSLFVSYIIVGLCLAGIAVYARKQQKSILATEAK